MNGLISTDLGSLKILIVARASPITIRRSGNIVSMVRVFTSLIYTSNFFLKIALVCKIKSYNPEYFVP